MSLADTLTKIQRTYGAESVGRLGDPGWRQPVEAISSGSIALDQALGIGGFGRGRIVEVFGPESSGKTTLLLHVLANAQALGGTCAFIDAEHALDPVYAEKVGVCTDELVISQPDYGEQGLNIAHDLIASGDVAVVCVDSVAALTPKAELDGEMGDQTVGLMARMMSQAMRKLAGVTHRTNTLLIFTNQIREKVGVVYGSPETQPGGRALKFFASQRLDVRRTGSDGAKGEETANQTKVTVKKNKLAPPFRIATFDIDFGRGISVEGELLDYGVEAGLVRKSGAWFYVKNEDGEDVGFQGRPNAKAGLLEDVALRTHLDRQVRGALGL